MVLLAQQIFFWHGHVAEDQSSCARPPAAHQTVDMSYLHTHISLNDKSADGVAAGPRVSDGEYQEEIGAFGADAKSLLSGEVVLVAFLSSCGGGTEEVGTASGLGERLSSPLCAGYKWFEIFLLLSLGAEHIYSLTNDGGD